MRKTAVGVAVAVLALSACGVPTRTVPHGATTASSCTGLPSECGDSYTATTTTAVPLPRPQDFTLTVTELSRKCFGSAGCNVEYRIVPTYLGPTGVPEGSFTLLYELDGGDDTQTGNIAVRNGHYHTEQGIISTPGDTLTAHVTQILED